MNELRKHLTSVGFTTWTNPLKSAENLCDWYAYRRSKLESRRCQCNYDKESMQIVITPHIIKFDNRTHRSVEVELTGEFNGTWYELKAYGLSPGEVKTKIDSIEKSLISAWNSL